MTSRRRVLRSVTVAVASTIVGPGGLLLIRPASATPEALQAAMTRFASGAAVETGRVKLQISELVENGNAVPVTISVDSPMTTIDHVRRIALFNQRNPLPDVAIFELKPANGRAEVGTRMRLATSQTVVAIAELSDGSFWQHRVDVIVTLAACIEGG